MQGKTAWRMEKSYVRVVLCAVLLCNYGMGYNRLKLRQAFKIKGSYLLDCLIYALPLCCFAASQESAEAALQAAEVYPDSKTIKTKQTFRFKRSRLESRFEESELDIEEGSRLVLLNMRMTHRSKDVIGPFSCGKDLSPPLDLESTGRSSEFRSKPNLAEVAIQPLDGDTYCIYSMLVGTPPFSFAKGMPHDSAAPPPTYLSLMEIQEIRPIERGILLMGLDQREDGALIYIDRQDLYEKREILKETLTLLEKPHSFLMNLQLPIELYEKRTLLERLTDRYCMAPFILEPASCKPDPVDKFIAAIIFGIGGLYTLTQQRLPLNSLLGETYQATYNDGTEVYGEQIAINPSISKHLVKGKQYTVTSTSILHTAFVAGVLSVGVKGKTFVQYEDGQEISFEVPEFQIKGFEKGDLTLSCVGKFTFKDLANRLSAEIRVGTEWKEVNSREMPIKLDSLLGRITRDEGTDEAVLYTIDGSWLEHICILNGEVVETVWDCHHCKPSFPTPVSQPLPSDFRFREDYIWLERERFDYADAWREKLEQRQGQNERLRLVNRPQRVISNRMKLLDQTP